MEREEEIESMMRRLEGYLEDKLQVNVGKTKMMRFRKGGGVVVEGEKDRGGEEIYVPGICVQEERRATRTYES